MNDSDLVYDILLDLSDILNVAVNEPYSFLIEVIGKKISKYEKLTSKIWVPICEKCFANFFPIGFNIKEREIDNPKECKFCSNQTNKEFFIHI